MATLLNNAVPATDLGYTDIVHTLRKRVTFADVGSTVTVGKLPAKASVFYGGVHVVTAFNAQTGNTVNVGFIGATTDASAYASAISTAAVGFIAFDDIATTKNIQGTVEHTVTVAFTESGTASTAGVGDVVVLYTIARS